MCVTEMLFCLSSGGLVTSRGICYGSWLTGVCLQSRRRRYSELCLLRSLKLRFPRVNAVGVGFGDWLEPCSRDKCQAHSFEGVEIYFTRCFLILEDIRDIDWTGLGDLGLIHYTLRLAGR